MPLLLALSRTPVYWITIRPAPSAVAVNERTTGLPTDASKLLAQAVAFWHVPSLLPATRKVLLDFAQRSLGAKASPAMVLNALRQLIAISPDLQTA